MTSIACSIWLSRSCFDSAGCSQSEICSVSGDPSGGIQSPAVSFSAEGLNAYLRASGVFGEKMIGAEPSPTKVKAAQKTGGRSPNRCK